MTKSTVYTCNTWLGDGHVLKPRLRHKAGPRLPNVHFRFSSHCMDLSHKKGHVCTHVQLHFTWRKPGPSRLYNKITVLINWPIPSNHSFDQALFPIKSRRQPRPQSWPRMHQCPVTLQTRGLATVTSCNHDFATQLGPDSPSFSSTFLRTALPLRTKLSTPAPTFSYTSPRASLGHVAFINKSPF